MKTPRIYGQTDWLAGSSSQGGRDGGGGGGGWFTRDGRTGLKLSLGGRKSARTLPFRRFLRWSFSFPHGGKYRLHFRVKGGLAAPTRREVSPSPRSLSLSLRLAGYFLLLLSLLFLTVSRVLVAWIEGGLRERGFISFRWIFFFLSFLFSLFLVRSSRSALNTGRNEAVKMFRHAQFIIGCEW